jgi:hypothetical protein
MTIGPSLSSADAQEQILATLKQILDRLVVMGRATLWGRSQRNDQAVCRAARRFASLPN